MKTKVTTNAQETIDAGIEFANTLSGGELIALYGDLGSGKTTYIKGLTEGLRVSDTVNSPTFVILKTYPAKIKDKNITFVHIDAYRVETLEDIISVGIEDYLNRDDVIMAIEWAEKIEKILPKNMIKIKFVHNDENERKIIINDLSN